MENQKHIVVVDDDSEIRSLLSNFLHKHNYLVSMAHNGNELFRLLKEEDNVDLIILDIMLPGLDGLAICRDLRQRSQIPIIMLTAVSDETDRIIGLELGADDYLTKPFNPRELLARIKAVLRRSQNEITVNNTAVTTNRYTRLKFSGWCLDTATRRLLSPENMEVPLSGRSYDLLLVFLEHPQRVLSRDQLLDILSNRIAESFDRSIDVQVSRLRQKLGDDPKDPKLIKTIRTGGYFFASPVTKA
jgi:two-component system OmpR family response regulator